VDAGAQIIGGQPVDLVHFLLKPEDWNAPRERLLPMARLAESQVREWERSQKK
jgi:hypothetical protein